MVRLLISAWGEVPNLLIERHPGMPHYSQISPVRYDSKIKTEIICRVIFTIKIATQFGPG
jgi:hypothetical protein